MEKNWHSLSWEEVVKVLKTDSKKGLSERGARVRQEKFGKNKLPEEKPLSKLRVFLEQFKSPLIYILLIAGIICLFFREFTDTIVILGVVFLNVIVGFLQENKASNILRELKKVLKAEAIILREGRERKIFQEDLVPGDIFILKPGDKVPADGRLIESFSLEINEAPLTGEWIAATKTSDILPEKTSLADRDNMVYMGTVAEAGSGKAIATETALKTEIGKVAKIVRELKEEKTPYQKRLANFSKIVGIILVFICLGILIEGMIAGREFQEMFIVAMAVAVAAIPEGLPVAMTVILALGMQRILRKKGLVRRLASVETLGSTSIIATDKTLTLTEGKMEISKTVTFGKEIEAENKKQWSEVFREKGDKDQILAMEIAVLANEAFIENPRRIWSLWKIQGRVTDTALIKGGAKMGLEKPKLEEKYQKLAEIPFNPINKFIATLWEINQEKILYVSGAPEKILALSSQVQVKGKEKILDEKIREQLSEKLENLTEKGLRVIATAYKKIRNPGKFELNSQMVRDLTFVGFIGLKDPLRKEAKEAISLCKKAGMKPIIVTGDHLLTAKAVARELGFKVENENVILGQDLDELSDKEFEKRLENLTVYARVEPKHKLRIIKAWQKRGEVVAMTGDGINDAPALKKADVGVALGSGTEVAKEASDLILLTDNFSTIVKAVREGRVILDNIRKVITYLISDSFTEVILVGVSIIAGVPLPVTALQILWVNLIEDGLPDIALSFEPEEKGIMKRKPEPHDVPLLTREMKALILIVGFFDDLILLALFFWLLRAGHDISFIRTMIFANLSIDTFYVAFTCKSLRKNIWEMNLFSNKFLVIATLLGILMLISAIYFPPLQVLLETVPLGIYDWSIVILLGLIDLGLIEVTKWYFIVKKEV